MFFVESGCKSLILRDSFFLFLRKLNNIAKVGKKYLRAKEKSTPYKLDSEEEI